MNLKLFDNGNDNNMLWERTQKPPVDKEVNGRTCREGKTKNVISRKRPHYENSKHIWDAKTKCCDGISSQQMARTREEREWWLTI